MIVLPSNFARFAFVSCIALSFLLLVQSPVRPQDENSNKEAWKQAYLSKDYGTALKLLKEKLKKDKKNASLWNNLGLTYIQLKNGKQAIKSFEKAIKFDRSNPVYLTNLGILYFQSFAHLRKAARVFDDAIEKGSKDPNTYYFRSRLYPYKEFDKRSAMLDRAIEYGTKEQQVYSSRIRIALVRFMADSRQGNLNEKTYEYLRKSRTLIEQCENICLQTNEMKMMEKRVSMLLSSRGSAPPQNSVSDNQEAKNCVPLMILTKSGLSFPPRAERKNATVKVITTFKSNGSIGETQVKTNAGKAYEEAALKVVRNISFVPRICNGIPVDETKTLTFTLKVY